jgi:uncharacterized membrane protein YgdD (TMEM256/DUF423 family)
MKLKSLLFVSGILSFFGVAFGAIGSHMLKNIILPDLLIIYETGIRYQIYHSLAIILLSLLYLKIPTSEFLFAGNLFVYGILFFSGSLYLLSITGIKKFGMITPIGGVLFLLGWIVMLKGIWKSKLD